ncbi:Uncharacterized protein KPSA1_06518 [Pseudomonas syringae pv. actinidiae]|uniref:Uncharacterized protein n=1 Tax=Pseudomonas syringae pv. actinidiae TaxID=103796 RepID=A0A2V0QQY4_PSESF|nr:Uncharacterized protein KPSA1_06518 [Pseudomonas syringae pv. actinidiae]
MGGFCCRFCLEGAIRYSGFDSAQHRVECLLKLRQIYLNPIGINRSAAGAIYSHRYSRSGEPSGVFAQGQLDTRAIQPKCLIG